jgi:hypothetical protein
MLSLKSTFPMLLHTVSASSSHSTAAAEPEAAAVSSSVFGRPQQLLTVGCRNWGNWWDGRGLLRVKIYDFAIYVDGEQVRVDNSKCTQQHSGPVGVLEQVAICDSAMCLMASR